MKRYRAEALKALATFTLIALTLAFILFPFFWMGIMSIKPETEHFIMPPKLIFKPTLEHWSAVMFGGAYAWQGSVGNATARAGTLTTTISGVRVLVNTSIIAGATTILAVLTALPAAYSFSRYKMKGSKDIQFFILAQRMAPPVSIILPLFTLLRWAGGHDTYWAIILTHLSINLPLAVWLLKGFIDDIPREIDESAELDGASPLTIIWRIIFSVVKPSIAAVAILCFVFSWNEFIFASTLAGPNTMPMTVFISTFRTNIQVDWSKLSTFVIAGSIPVVIMALSFQKYFVRGLTFGAVKG